MIFEKLSTRTRVAGNRRHTEKAVLALTAL